MARSCQWRLTHPRLPRGYGGAGISPGFRQPLTWRSWSRGKWGWQLGANLRWPPPQIHGPRALFLLVSAGFRYKSALETHFHRHRPSRLLDVWASQLRPVLCSFFVPPWAGKWTPLRGIASESMLKTGSVVSSVFAHGMGLVLRQGSIPYVDPFF